MQRLSLFEGVHVRKPALLATFAFFTVCGAAHEEFDMTARSRHRRDTAVVLAENGDDHAGLRSSAWHTSSSEDRVPSALAATAGAAPRVRALQSAARGEPRSVAVSNDGSVLVAGVMAGGGAFVARYSEEGELTWSEDLGSEEVGITASGVASGLDGSVVVAGTVTAAADGTGGGLDAFVLKYSSAGEVQWLRQIGGAGEDTGADVAVADSDGSVFVSGSLAAQAFVAKYTDSGELIWAQTMGANGTSAQGNSVAAGANGSVVMAGSVTSTPGSGLGRQGFIARYSMNGTIEWAQYVSLSVDDVARSVDVGVGGEVFVVGTMTILNTDAATNMTEVSTDAFIAQYAPNGTKNWATRLDTGISDVGDGVVACADGSAFLAGTIMGTDGRDAMIAKYSSFGAAVWARRTNTGENDRTRGIASADCVSSVLVGATTAIGPDDAASPDGFLVKYLSDGNTDWSQRLNTASFATSATGASIASPSVVTLAPRLITGPTATVSLTTSVLLTSPPPLLTSPPPFVDGPDVGSDETHNDTSAQIAVVVSSSRSSPAGAVAISISFVVLIFLVRVHE